MNTAVPASEPRHKVATPGMLSSIASILLGAMAGGALWCFASVSTVHDTDALIIPIGFALGLFLRWQGFSGGRAKGCAALSTLLAFGYAQILFGAIRIAQMMGAPLREVLFKADFMLIVDAARLDLQRSDWLYLAIAVALSVIAVAWRGRTT